MNARRIDTLLELLHKEPDDIFLNYALGLEFATAPSMIDKAEEQFKKVTTLDQDYIAAWYQLGKLFESTHPEKAIDYYKSGIEKARLKKDHKAINEFSEAIFLLEE